MTFELYSLRKGTLFDSDGSKQTEVSTQIDHDSYPTNIKLVRKSYTYTLEGALTVHTVSIGRLGEAIINVRADEPDFPAYTVPYILHMDRDSSHHPTRGNASRSIDLCPRRHGWAKQVICVGKAATKYRVGDLVHNCT